MHVLKKERFIPYKTIEQEVDALIAKSERVLGYKIDQLPIPIEKIAEFVLDLTIEWVENLPNDGSGETLGQILPNQKLIQINNSILQHQPERLNFTLAHEIAHYQLHFQYIPPDIPVKTHQLFDYLADNDNLRKPRQERQAEYFASALLAPKNLLYKTMQNRILSMETIYTVARRFQISPTAMRIRLEQLNYIYVAPDKKVYPSKQEMHGQMRLPNFY